MTSPLTAIDDIVVQHFLDMIGPHHAQTDEEGECDICAAVERELPEIFRLARLAIAAGLGAS